MATVLIEMGSTGATESTQSSLSARSSPARCRRITLASDEAKAAADALRKVSNIQREATLQREAFVQRSTSLPDPDIDLGPPRADPPDHWRASTGRQDLSKRQLEVLRTMLRTPVPSRAGMYSRASTISASSSGGVVFPNSTTRLVLNTSRTPSSVRSEVSFPSPADSNYVVPCDSFPSPLTASRLANPRRATLKSRRSSKAGLAGFKDFIRSLKGSSPPGKATPQSDYSASSRTDRGQSPRSPNTPSSARLENNTRPNTASYSADNPSRQGAPPLRRIPSPEKGAKRPSIRNVFRTSSGNWSDLVRGGGGGGGPTSSVPPLPSLPRKSTESGQSTCSQVEHEGLPNVGGQGMVKTASGQSGKAVKTPTNLTFSFNPTKGWKSTKSGKRPTTPGNRRSAEPPVPTVSPVYERGVEKQGQKGQGDLTIRPGRKSRILGLGMPSLPSSPSSPGWTPPAAQTGTSYTTRTEVGVTGALSTSTSLEESSLGGMGGGKMRMEGLDGMASDDEDLVVALTPENLPVLLEYLRQCEGKLSEWKRRAEGLLGVGVGTATST